MPVTTLRRGMAKGREWADRYGRRRAFNPGYASVGVPVPQAQLMQAIAQAIMDLP